MTLDELSGLGYDICSKISEALKNAKTDDILYYVDGYNNYGTYVIAALEPKL